VKAGLAGLALSVALATCAGAQPVTMAELLAEGGQIVEVHINQGYPEFYILTQTTPAGLFICRANGNEFGTFANYLLPDTAVPTTIATLCAVFR